MSSGNPIPESRLFIRDIGITPHQNHRMPKAALFQDMITNVHNHGPSVMRPHPAIGITKCQLWAPSSPPRIGGANTGPHIHGQIRVVTIHCPLS
ncbi:hypothetical protein NPIL_300011 [Nephila pilipes]|uniref:Uncharacterized protein n=1 Tax=Nephila pilipes TaxID=299642 RepID=A0A8X6URF5_NEPPI|nr:hypothetical protein NPIL_300011 [Nephila pilipes]